MNAGEAKMAAVQPAVARLFCLPVSLDHAASSATATTVSTKPPAHHWQPSRRRRQRPLMSIGDYQRAVGPSVWCQFHRLQAIVQLAGRRQQRALDGRFLGFSQ
jgi:hypothetical protein